MFELASADIRPRVIMSLDGMPGSGRTRFALSAPKPLYVVLLDAGGLEGVLTDTEDVMVAKYDVRKSMTKDEAQSVAQEIEDDIIEARENARSVVIDKCSYLWPVLRLAEFGKLTKVQARYYDAVNIRMSELIRSFVETDTNLLLIHDLKDAYEDDKKVGQKRDGFPGIEGIVRHAALFSAADNSDQPFKMRVTKATTNWDLVGTEFEGDAIDFPQYATLAVPQLDAGYWI